MKVNVTMLLIVLTFIVLDLVVGLIKAFSTGSYKSLKMRDGLWHKLGEIIAVGLGALCEMAFPYVGINVNIPLVNTICVYIVLMETGSIIENLAIISPNMQKVLAKVFGDYKQESEE